MSLSDTTIPRVTLVTVKAPSVVQIPKDVALVLQFAGPWGVGSAPTVKLEWITQTNTIPSSWTPTIDNIAHTITYSTESNTIVFPQSFYSAGSTVKIYINGTAQPTDPRYYNEFNDA